MLVFQMRWCFACLGSCLIQSIMMQCLKMFRCDFFYFFMQIPNLQYLLDDVCLKFLSSTFQSLSIMPRHFNIKILLCSNANNDFCNCRCLGSVNRFTNIILLQPYFLYFSLEPVQFSGTLGASIVHCATPIMVVVLIQILVHVLVIDGICRLVDCTDLIHNQATAANNFC